nr:phosphopantetheine-binding protein [Fischerella sp. JS2]
MPNGKLNRQALPAPNLEQSKLEGTFVAPQTAAEEVIARIWGQVLGLNEIGIHDNFFELSGHSLMVTQVTSRLRQVFQVELPIRNLFESPTVAGLIDAIAKIWGDRQVVEEIAQTWQEVEKISMEEVETILSTQIN